MNGRQAKVINQGQEDEMEVWGYRPCWWKILLVGLGAVCSGGLLLLMLYWLPQWGVKATCTHTSLKEAQRLLLRTTDDFGRWFRIKVRVLLAPGKTPFDDLESTSCLQKGELYHRELVKKTNLKQTTDPGSSVCSAQVHYFTHHNIKYYWNEDAQNFGAYKGLEDTNVSCADIHTKHSSGLTGALQEYRALFFGKNLIDVKMPPLFKIFINEVLNPFYIFQLFAVIVWCLEKRYEFGLFLLLLSCALLAFSLCTVRKHHVRLRDMVLAHSMLQVSVCRRNEDVERVMSTELVLGDVFTIPTNGMMMPCEAVLIRGACTVDESMLTGESAPVTKTSVPSSGEEADRIYNTEEHKQHTLFCGSHVIQSRCGAGELVKVVVVRTGFSMEKGQLVHSILHPKPTDFKLHRDALHFMMCMGGLGVIGCIYSVVLHVTRGVAPEIVVHASLGLVTVAVTPILPVALTAGLLNAQRRMKRVGIFCTSPQRINISGQLNLICFDKTGTLTEDSLNLWGIQRAKDGMFSSPETEVTTETLAKTSFVACMATCHSLVRIEDKLCGDPLDLKVFNATGWILAEPAEEQPALHDDDISTVVKHPQQGVELGIVLHFPFSSTLQRMSVVVRQLGQKHFDVYLKGAPETVVNLCKPHTVPQSFTETLETYTRQGFRVIALAHHQLESILSWPEVQNLSREQLETNMDFLGLIIMQNKIKEQTAGVLLDLRRANIRTLMVTGDNMSTALSVARDCGMVPDHENIIIADAVPPNDENPARITWRYSDNRVVRNKKTPRVIFADEGMQGEDPAGYHFAVSGPAFAVIAEHFPQLLPKFLLRATVFARMTPDQKTQLVQGLQSMDYIVGMCGDGANDCGALKKAHVGISLSELEASVASPFTSAIPNISCVTNLIKKGRAALVTSFCVFKFLALSSIIVTSGMLLLYWVLSSFGSVQFICMAIGMSVSLPFTMSMNPARKKLVRRTPPTNLKSGLVVFSVLSQMLNCLLFQLLTFFLVQQQSWYDTLEPVWINKFRTHGSVNNLNRKDTDGQSHSGRPKSSRTPQNVDAVRDSVVRKSVRRRSQELGMNRESVRRILIAVLHLYPYGIQIQQKLTPADKRIQVIMCQWFCDKIDAAPDSLDNVWFSDEAHFLLSGHVNSKKNIFWGSTPPETSRSCNENSTVVEFEEAYVKKFENTSLFYVTSFQYLIVAIVYSKGKPFRQPSYKNWPFVLTCASLYVFYLFVMLYPLPAIDNALLIVCIPYDWRITLLMIVMAHTVVAFTLEVLIVDTLWKIVQSKLATRALTAHTTQMVNGPWGWNFLSWMLCCKNRSPKTKYKLLTLELQELTDWPPAPSTITYAGTPQYLIADP
ncbi:polyamine-transporting ATPase 13A3-like [Nerophis ophidion]|uniref:polyamine-transporting ATPase 13A3-like n=1 Tax=Nerophis ophidion TaxID=159077 RepID=UPI002AE01BCF|nr:polyamine-transporting ATPase 13A3-like [Nerophis ophidion]